MAEWYSVSELAEKTEIAEPSVRRYISNFQSYFISKGGSRAKKYDPSAIDILKRIKQLYKAGYETEGVREFIKHEFPVIVTDKEMAETTEDTIKPTLATSEDVAKLEKSIIAKVDEMFSEQKEELSQILQKLDQRQKQIEQKEKQIEQKERLLEEREQLLIEKPQEKNELVEPPKEKKPGLFKRLFG